MSAVFNTITVLLCAITVLLCLIALSTEAQTQNCAKTFTYPSLRAQFHHYQHASVDTPELDKESSRLTSTELWFEHKEFDHKELKHKKYKHKQTGHKRSMQSQTAWGFGQRYRPFSFDENSSNSLQTNGHLHHLFAAWHYRSHEQNSSWQLGLAPVLAVSSNLLKKKPGKINTGALQLQLHAELAHALNKNLQLLLGVCADDRLDHYRGYPLIGIGWRPNAQIDIRLAFPDSFLRYKPTNNWLLSVFLHPSGGIWQVYDEDRDQSTRFRYRSWQTALAVERKLSQHWWLGLTWGVEFQRKFHFRLLDEGQSQPAPSLGQRLSTKAGSQRFAGLHLEWRW